MNQNGSESTVHALVTNISIGTGAHQPGPLVDWMVKTMMASADSRGFVSAEIAPPESQATGNWSLVQRFLDKSQLISWQESDLQRHLLDDLRSQYPGDALAIKQVEDSQEGSAGVTTAIVTHVAKGMESRYRDWEIKVQQAQAKFPGYRGSYMQPPTGSGNGMWVSLLRFDTPDSLEKWVNSAERKELLKEAETLIEKFELKKVSGSFPGFVPVDETTGNAPSNWKVYLLILLGLYPIVMLEIKYLMPHLAPVVPSAPASLIGNMISVAGTTWVTMPLFIIWFKEWLFPKGGKTTWQLELKWHVIVVALFSLEVALLWNLLS